MLGTILGAAMATGWLIAAVAKGKDGLRAARAGLLVALATFVPVIFDPHTGDVYNLPKYTLVVVAALALAGLWVVAAVHRRPLPLWRNGLQWLIGGIVVWTAVSAFAGVDTHVGLLGNYGSYDGLFLAAALGVVAMVTAEAFDVDDVRKVLAALAFAGGGVVMYYGLIQLHDVEFSGSKPWDFIQLHNVFVHGEHLFDVRQPEPPRRLPGHDLPRRGRARAGSETLVLARRRRRRRHRLDRRGGPHGRSRCLGRRRRRRAGPGCLRCA